MIDKFYEQLGQLQRELMLAQIEWDQAIVGCDDNKTLEQGEDYIQDNVHHAFKKVHTVMDEISKLAIARGLAILASDEPLTVDD